MSDLISRQAVLETIDSRIEQIKKNTNAMNKSYPHLSFAEGVHDGYCRLKCDLRILPSVSVSENPNKWIPVTERLPEESGRYLTYIVNEYDEELQYIMTADYIARPTPIEGLSPWYVDDECASDNVVAWQPLPEPYKER